MMVANLLLFISVFAVAPVAPVMPPQPSPENKAVIDELRLRIEVLNAQLNTMQLQTEGISTEKIASLQATIDGLEAQISEISSRSPWSGLAKSTRSIGIILVLGYFVLSILIFAVLVVASHWSPLAFKLLFSGRMRRFGLYYGMMLCWVRPVKIWVMSPYFRSLQGSFDSDHSYVDQIIILPDGSKVPGSGLLDRLLANKMRLAWMQGGPGTGKTEMIAELMRRYLAAPSLRLAFKHRRLIPVVVAMRGVESRLFEDRIRDVMASYGLVFDDEVFFGRFLRSGGFLVILDGLNEANLDERLRDGIVLGLAKSAKRVKLLTTSQTPPPRDSQALDLYRLPPTTPELAHELLTAFLGGPKGLEAIENTPKSLWKEISSAYDVRLLADLVSRCAALPGDRLGLYQAALDLAAMAWDARGPFREDIVCRLAWDSWLAQSGWYITGRQIDPPVLRSLEWSAILIRHGANGDNVLYEFRHEQMQGYLAARWVAVHSVSPVSRLEEEAVWALSPSEQDRVFPFLAELSAALGTQRELEELVEFALERPVERSRLQGAAIEAARVRNWTLETNVGPQRLRYVRSLSELEDAEFEAIIIGLGLDRASLPEGSQGLKASAVVRLAKRFSMLPRLEELLSRFYKNTSAVA